ncbi:MAG: type II toxin-antitoxin system VapC family toxin [Dehalococcoidia bacterium]
MKVDDALNNVARLFLDTAPLIYLVERNPRYFDVVLSIFDRIDDGQVAGVTSPVTLAECLVVPYRIQSPNLRQLYIDQIVAGSNTTFVTIDDTVAKRAADLRARHNLRLADALQVSIALLAGCDALLTNDTTFRRVADLRILLIDDVEP